MSTFKYVGRVSSFYSGVGEVYSETYDPPRQTPQGRFWRIECRMVGGSWHYIGFGGSADDASGSAAPGVGASDCRFWSPLAGEAFPLVYNPMREREYAVMLLGQHQNKRAVSVGESLLVHGSDDMKEVGVVHIRGLTRD